MVYWTLVNKENIASVTNINMYVLQYMELLLRHGRFPVLKSDAIWMCFCLFNKMIFWFFLCSSLTTSWLGLRTSVDTMVITTGKTSMAFTANRHYILTNAHHHLFFFFISQLFFFLPDWTASTRSMWRSAWLQANAPRSHSSSPSTTRWRWNRPLSWWRVEGESSCLLLCLPPFPCSEYRVSIF